MRSHYWINAREHAAALGAVGTAASKPLRPSTCCTPGAVHDSSVVSMTSKHKLKHLSEVHTSESTVPNGLETAYLMAQK